MGTADANGNDYRDAMQLISECLAGLPCQKLAEMLDPVTVRGKIRLRGKIVGLAVGR